MEPYNFWQDFFDTYQSLSDIMKALWLIVPPAFLLGLIALVMRHRVALKEVENGVSGDLVYTIHRDDYGELQVYRHDPELGHEPALVLLEREPSAQLKPPLTDGPQ